MGLSDIPPPTTMCLKRCRSEESSSLTELCAPPPKQAFLASPALCTQSTHQLSLLAELESSLDAPMVEAPTPEELVMEMMQSLERVMGDIGELVSVSGEGTICVEALVNLPQRRIISQDMAPHYAESELAEVSGEGTLRVGNIVHAQQRLDSIRGVTLGCGECELASELDSYARDDLDACGAVSELHSYTGAGSDEGGAGCCDAEDSNLCDWGERYVEEGRLEGGCDGDHVGLDNMQHLLDMSDDELGISQAGVVHTSSGELKDDQWNLLDDFAAAVACNEGVSCSAFLEEGYDFSSFTLSQDDQGTLARAREHGMLDCCF